MLCISDGVADCVEPVIPKPTERQRIGNQIKAAMVCTRGDFVNVHQPQRRKLAFQSQADSGCLCGVSR